MNMKFSTSVAVVALTILLLFTGARAHAQTHSWRCNDRLIRGDFAFVVDGYKLGGPPGSPIGPMKGVAMTTFDGDGTLTQIDTVVVNGLPQADFTEAQASGTYEVNPDCTGTFTITFTDKRPQVTVNFVVANNGNEIDTVVVNPPGVLLVGSIGKRRFSRPRPRPFPE